MDSPDSTRRALVTGASSGIGKAIALAYAEAGVDVALVGRSQSKLTAVADAIAGLVSAKTYAVDLSVLTDVKREIADIIADFGGIDTLANNAGIGYTNPVSETPLDDWQQTIDLNLTSPFLCIQAVLPHLRARGGGTIVNVASIAARSPFPGWGAYSATKAGIVALSKALAAEERDNHIRVISVLPGAVDTPLWDSDTVGVELNRAAMLPPEAVGRAIVQATLLPYQATVEELVVMPSAGAL